MYRLASGDPFLNRAFRFVLRLVFPVQSAFPNATRLSNSSSVAGSAFCLIALNRGNFDLVML